MPEFHAEPYIHLAGLSHKSALIAWGAFYFQTRTHHEWKLVDDQDLRHIHPPRRESIGARSDPYGPARVNVYDMNGALAATSFTETTNFCWIAGLKSDTPYRYEVIVKDEMWAEGERWDWTPGTTQGLVQRGGRYRNEFRTHPDPAAEPAGSFIFMVLGDYGTGIRKSTPKRRQREVAEAMQRTFDQHDVRLILTAGDNIYAGTRILGLPVGAQGDEDDDWFFTFFQPYRYMINRVPVYPCIGNHDTDESEDRDDREQLLDNMYLRERIASDEASGRASVDPGLFYRFRYGRDVEFICLDTSKEGFFRGKRLFEYPKHWEWIEQTFEPAPGVRWRLPFCHHPPFCAGPRHHNTDRMERLVPLFVRGGVRAVFSGHEHNFQHSSHQGIDYFVTGAGSKVRKGAPDDLARAHTLSWADEAHFLLVTIAGETMAVRAIGELEEGEVRDLPRVTADGRRLAGPDGGSAVAHCIIRGLMKRSTERILTTHTGSLIRPPKLLDLVRARQGGTPIDQSAFDATLRESVREVVERQVEAGIDVPNDGEFGKSTSWSLYALKRLSGFECREVKGANPFARGADRQRFAEFYAELEGRGDGKDWSNVTRTDAVCVGEIEYNGLFELQRDIDNLKAATKAAGVDEAFLPVAAPSSAIPDRKNEYYKSDEELVVALAEALRTEYRAIVDAGFLLQVDDARAAVTYDRMVPPATFEDYYKWLARHVDVLNHALEGIPQDRIRYHVCWGSWPGPHTTDVPLRKIVDLILKVNAGAYLIEAANPRHEHEWKVWQEVKLPPGKILVPGVVSHGTNVVEHPELIAERLARFASCVGRENLIAGTDCGFAQEELNRRVHPSVMWAKLEAMAEGARIATRKLWGTAAAAAV